MLSENCKHLTLLLVVNYYGGVFWQFNLWNIKYHFSETFVFVRLIVNLLFGFNLGAYTDKLRDDITNRLNADSSNCDVLYLVTLIIIPPARW